MDPQVVIDSHEINRQNGTFYHVLVHQGRLACELLILLQLLLRTPCERRLWPLCIEPTSREKYDPLRTGFLSLSTIYGAESFFDMEAIPCVVGCLVASQVSIYPTPTKPHPQW
jgi:hypothetical protein